MIENVFFPKDFKHYFPAERGCATSGSSGHQTSTCIENVKFREVNVDLLPGTSSGKLKIPFRNYESSRSKRAAGKITHSTAYTHEIRMF